MDILVYQILLWWWQSFFLQRNWEYHIKFGYTFVTETWPCIPYGVLESYHLACVQIIGIIHAHLNYNHFNSIHICGTGLALTHTGYTTYQYHKAFAAIFQLPLCSMNMDTRMVLLCFWWRSFNEEIAAIPPASIFYPPIDMQQYFDQHSSRWLALCHRVEMWYFSNYHASYILVIIRLK